MIISQRNIQFAKFIVVGLLNTSVTLITIFLCKSIIGLNPYLSNAFGYIAGVINSFLWNRSWVFKSHGKVEAEAIKFIVGFGCCYLLQLLFVWSTTTYSPLATLELDIAGFTLSGYGIATLMGMCVYTLCNFVYNRKIAFTSHR
jgi:putative flippase GtrA